MHISNCLHPVLIKNKYTGNMEYVPCGKCAVCTLNHSSEWVTRLTEERRCWKYCLFFTLTFAPKYRPTLKCENDVLFDTSFTHANPELGTIHFTFNDVKAPEKDIAWLRRNNNELPYVTAYDAQKFIKRLRRNLEYKAKKENEYYTKYYPDWKKLEAKDYQVRYFLVSEYGETTLLPHMHGLLFFSSDWCAKNIQEIVYKSWKFGIVDSSFTERDSIKYVAKYVNCTSHLPSFYEYKRIKPFAIFSKCPPIGTLQRDEKEIKEMFFNASPDFAVRSWQGNSFNNVPLWRTYIGKLYPKISGFNQFSHFNRTQLYRASESSNCEEWKDFLYHCQWHAFTSQFLNDYVDTITDNLQNIGPLQRWWLVSRRVCVQSAAWNIDVGNYVGIIERFYQNVDYKKLTQQLEFEQDYAEERGNSELLSLDPIFYDYVCSSTLTKCFEDFMLEFGDTLILYDIDPEKFYTDQSYQRSLKFNKSYDYTCLQINYNKILKDSCKTKRKNDYLNKHPKLWAKVYD